MKKILLLGGSAQQIVAIETAKKMGYYTILCDYLEDNPGQNYADKFYLVSTTDKDAILDVAKNKSIDGILAYASDPAAPTAAYVAEKLGLPTNPYESVDTLCNKDKFRRFLATNGFNSPKSFSCSDFNEVENFVSNLKLPVIIKPVDSSGSKGVTVVNTMNSFQNAFEYALSFSRVKRVIVEEYIERNHTYIIGGDIFVSEGKIVLWGLLNCHRDNEVNSLVPVGKSYPLDLSSDYLSKVKETLQSMVHKLGIKFGAMNVELIVDKNDEVWPLDIGPRNGGNMIPDLLGMIYNIDIVEMSVLSCMGEKIAYKENEGSMYYATHNIHSAKNGVLVSIDIEQELRKYVIKECIYCKKGDFIEYFDYSSKVLGIIFMKFPSKEIMFRMIDNINEYININTEC